MILPGATLFPQSLLPLYIFEPRYRQMLADVLASHRMFVVAMQRPCCMRELPLPVAGLGLVRVSVTHPDGTSHLILQGLARVALGETVRYKPYRLMRVEPLPSQSAPDEILEPLLQRIRRLLRQRLDSHQPFPGITVWTADEAHPTAGPCSEFTARQLLEFVANLKEPECVADLISSTFIRQPTDRQVLLSTLNVAERLQLLAALLEEELARPPGKKA